MRPLIAIPGRRVPRTEVEGVRDDAIAGGAAYLRALDRAGGEGCLLLPRSHDWHRVIDRFDGVLLLGGGDVDPARYDAAAAPEVAGVDDGHDEAELWAFLAAVQLGRPVLAICRGVQVMNVALGGTLVQHLPGPRVVEHRITLDPGSRTASAMRTAMPLVRCAHHQALDRLGVGLVVTARNAEGGIEGAELDGHPWAVGVQWHPEDTADQDGANQGLFDAFVDACAGGVRTARR